MSNNALEALLREHRIEYLHAASEEAETWSRVIEFETTDGHYEGVLLYEGELLGFSWEWFTEPPIALQMAFSDLPVDALHELDRITRIPVSINVSDILAADGVQ